VRFLVAHGANLNLKNEEGKTALQLSTGACELLLQRGGVPVPDCDKEEKQSSSYSNAPAGTAMAQKEWVMGSFHASHVLPFDKPNEPPAERHVFFLSHRGPDTKKDLVRPLSYILSQLRVPHFFDQSDESMRLGLDSVFQMQQAAWYCHVGVVIFSAGFRDSEWCLKELNTFLKRQRSLPKGAPPILLPVYENELLMSRDVMCREHQLQIYNEDDGSTRSSNWRDATNNVSAIVRNPEHSYSSFLITMIPRILGVETVKDHPSVIEANRLLKQNPTLLQKLYDQFRRHTDAAIPMFSRAGPELPGDIDVFALSHKAEPPRDSPQALFDLLKLFEAIESKSSQADMRQLLGQISMVLNTPHPKRFHTPLSFAAALGATEAAAVLIEAGADVNRSDEMECTPLDLAAEKGHTKIVEMLLQAGARVDPADRKKKSPLIIAAERGQKPCVEALLQGGADPLRTYNSKSVLGFVCTARTADLSKKPQITKLLQNAINAADGAQ